MVDGLAVQISHLLDAGQFLKFLYGANADHLFEVVRHPDGDGVAPEAVPGKAPVLRILQPVIEPSNLSELGHPIGLLVVLDQLFLDFGDLEEPAVDGLVDQGGLRSPAVRVVMPDSVVLHDAALLEQILPDLVVSGFDIDARILFDLRGIHPIVINRDGRVVGLHNLVLD